MRRFIPGLLSLALVLSACAPLAGGTPVGRPTQPPEGLFATPPHNTPSVAGPLLHWENKECDALESDGQNLSYGRCGGALTNVPATPEDLLRLEQWQALYQPIDASAQATPAGILIFNGDGTVSATEAEQRAMAEWASLRHDELVAGRTSAGWKLALDWHREGGIAGFCDEVTVYLTGDYYVANCKTPTPTSAPTTRPSLPLHLDPDQLVQLYTWYDNLATFDYSYTDPAPTDAMTTRFSFNGRGKQPATDEDIQAINDFASSLVVQAAYPPAALAAEQALSDSLGIPVSEITIASVTAEEWSDACLGVQTPGIMCAQVITPGYLVELEANGAQYTYHTDQTGGIVVAAP